MVKDVNYDYVASALAVMLIRTEDAESDEQPELPLEYDCDARDYYQVLSEVVDTISCVADILKNLPEHVVKAADIRIKIDYSDNVVGTLVMTGE